MAEKSTILFPFFEKKQKQWPKNNYFIEGLLGAGKAFFWYFFYGKIEKPQLFIAENEEKALFFINDLEALGVEEVYFFPELKEKNEEENDPNRAACLQYRSEALNALSQGKAAKIVSFPKALKHAVISEKILKKNSFFFETEKEIGFDFVIDFLQEHHFKCVDFVYQPGEYSVRGGIVDVFSYAYQDPYRLDFWGDIIESIRFFDPISQRSIENEKIEKVQLLPDLSNTYLLKEKVSLFEFMGFPLIFLSNNEAFLQNEYEKPIAEIEKKCSFVEWGDTSYFAEEKIKLETEPQHLFQGDFKKFLREVKDFENQGYQLYFSASQQSQLERLDGILKEEKIHYTLLKMRLSEGFIDHDNKLICYTDHQIFERYHRYQVKEKIKRNFQALQIQSLFELQKGDFVVHLDHGIGKYGGLISIENNGKKQEVVKVIYQKSDVLLVSIHALHKLSRFAGEDANPTLHTLGTSKWQQTKDKAKKKIKELAFDLIAVYASRKMSQGFAFSKDSYLQKELEASFAYEDTPDQLKITEEIKKDMESSKPMDRLICGDVGFGKTELAIRAAFKAVTDGKQVAVLVPTTVLAFQHFRSFSKRLKNFPVRIGILHRFCSAAQNKKTLEELKNGKIDIVIGTHKIVGKEVAFKDLGLLIIDEEQKFGVNVKDKLKTLRASLDILTLTATPIPRTLQFSLLGARDLSLLQTPPLNRQPIHTSLHAFNDKLIQEVILKEIHRGGQVYFIHNHVQSLEEIERRLLQLVPGLRIAIAHGQLEGKVLEERILSFMEGEAELLLCTTLVENGIDVPTANTILINNAQNFGLSDLHQMRGRVGRSSTQAFCYLLVPSLLNLGGISKKRLDTLTYYNDLGSGFQIAMKDLDLRGAGSLLGGEQSGFVAEMGFETYQKILQESMEELKEELKWKNNEQPATMAESGLGKNYITLPHFDTDWDLRLPESYIEDAGTRLQMYRALGNCKDLYALEKVQKEMEDRFGKLPDLAKNLILSMEILILAARMKVEKIILKQESIRFTFAPHTFKDENNKNWENLIFFVQSKKNKEVLLQEKEEKMFLQLNKIQSLGQIKKILVDELKL